VQVATSASLVFRPPVMAACATHTALQTTEARERWALRPQPVPQAITSAGPGESVILRTPCTTLRELRLTDAPSLLELLSTEEVARFISPPPTTVEGYIKFIDWAHRERRAGRHACFAIVPTGGEAAIGIVQVRALSQDWQVAEWGFAIGSGYWGTGLFLPSAEAVVHYSFEHLNVHRLEARAARANGRGIGALLKIGATQEAVLRRSFLCRGQYVDQGLWVILRDLWTPRPEVRITH
jgi:ribosomal-protein-alanine N-acetyltransferase